MPSRGAVQAPRSGERGRDRGIDLGASPVGVSVRAGWVFGPLQPFVEPGLRQSRLPAISGIALRVYDAVYTVEVVVEHANEEYGSATRRPVVGPVAQTPSSVLASVLPSEVASKMRAGNAALAGWLAPQRVPLPRSDAFAVRARLAVQRQVTTWAGEFDTPRYRTKKDGGGVPIGVNILLEFTPNEKVDARKIGMVQAVNSKDLGVPLAINAEVGNRSIAAGRNKGLHIDQLGGHVNPIFYTQPGAAGDTLSSTARAADGRDGFRFLDGTGAEKKRSARIADIPTLEGHGANASQIFESTALALTGAQAGSYYGSVQWGWRTNAAGKFSRLPLTLKSEGAPSASFNAARRLWNTTKTAAGAAHVRLSGVLVRFAAAADTEVAAAPGAASTAKMARGDEVQVTGSGRGAQRDWRHITVTTGANTGLVGWTLNANLTATKPAP